MNLTQIKQFKKTQGKVDKVYWIKRQENENKLFNKVVPKWLQWFMEHSPWLTQKLDYRIGCVDWNEDKLVLTRQGKIVSKTF